MADNAILASALAASTTADLLQTPPDVLRDAAIALAEGGLFEKAAIAGVKRDLAACRADGSERSRQTAASLAFVLLVYSSDLPTEENRTSISEHMADSQELRQLLADIYHLPSDIETASLRFLEFGTTSILLQATSRDNGDVAVKLLKPRYWRTERVVERTRTYKDTFGSIIYCSPKVYSSDAHVIVMRLVKGLTLHEWLKQNKALASDAYYRKLIGIFECLLDRLNQLDEQFHLSHLDLNPKNIIIEERAGLAAEVWLIDFGANYAVTEYVGAPGQYYSILESVKLFVAREVHEGALTYAPRADAFSVGMLLAASLIQEELTTKSLGALLLSLWEISPGLAECIEDLIEEDPSHRLLGRPADEQHLFVHLKERLKAAAEFYLDVEQKLARNEPRLQNSWTFFIGGIWMGEVANVRLWGATLPQNQTAEGPGAAYYKAWAYLALACHSLIVGLAVLLTAVDLAHSDTGGWPDIAQGVLNFLMKFASLPFLDDFFDWYQTQTMLPVRVGDVLANLPGRLVCVSFSVVACRYYLRVFSLINPNTRSDLLSRGSELAMRANAFSFLIPILIALIVQPKWWPYCVFAGILPVVLNNWLVAKLLVRAHREGASFYSDDIQNTEQFIFIFNRWWWQMLSYGTVCFIIGPLLLYGVLKDEWAYAALVILLNEFQIIHVIVGGDGYVARGGIKRLLFLDRRIRLLRAAKARAISPAV